METYPFSNLPRPAKHWLRMVTMGEGANDKPRPVIDHVSISEFQHGHKLAHWHVDVAFTSEPGTYGFDVLQALRHFPPTLQLYDCYIQNHGITFQFCTR